MILDWSCTFYGKSFAPLFFCIGKCFAFIFIGSLWNLLLPEVQWQRSLTWVKTVKSGQIWLFWLRPVFERLRGIVPMSLIGSNTGQIWLFWLRWAIYALGHLVKLSTQEQVLSHLSHPSSLIFFNCFSDMRCCRFDRAHSFRRHVCYLC